MDKLSVGESFPTLTAVAAGGRTYSVPADLEGRRAVLLFYRGRW
ncbi:MAG: hypothetical protein ABFS34_08665 [Gemmatimonadota bacterium]